MNEYDNYVSHDFDRDDDWVDFYIKQQKEDALLNEKKVSFAIVEIGEWVYV